MMCQTTPSGRLWPFSVPASGKSALAVHLARLFDGEVVNFDSLQLYRGLDIGTAKTPLDERHGVPHHCLDLLDPADVFNAGAWAALARTLLAEITGRHRLPILAGGTGFYLRALFDGLSDGPARSDEMRGRLMRRQQSRTGSLHRILARLDPPVAARIHPNDVNKTIRALEICLLARQPATALFQQGKTALRGYRALKLALDPDRSALRERIALRSRRMFDLGLADEVRGLLERGVPHDAKAFESIGYRQALALLDGRMTLEQAVEDTRIATAQYAKRQCTWFRKEPGVLRLAGFGDDPAVAERAREAVTSLLESLQRQPEKH